MQNAECKTQNKFSAFRFPFSVLNSTIRTLTVGIGISPIQSHTRNNLSICTIRESRTITAGREFHPAPSVLNAKVNKKNGKPKMFPVFNRLNISL